MLFRQKHHAHAIFARGRQRDALRGHFFAVQRVRQLNQNARAVAHQLVGTHGAPVVEVFKNLQGLRDDGMAFVALDMGDKTDAARIVLVGTCIQTVLFKMLDFSSCSHRESFFNIHRGFK